MKFEGRWFPDNKEFREECLKISQDLTDFKSNVIYQRHISPGMQRFIKVKKDISVFDYSSVVEIGSGYGGQCQIIKCKNYTLIDIPESLEVAKAYLKKNNIKANFISTENIKNIKADLCISNYALSELNNQGIVFYMNNIIKYCKYIYLTVYKTETKRILSLLGNYFEIEIDQKSHKRDNVLTGKNVQL